MVTIGRLKNAQVVKELVTHPDIWDYIMDDTSPSKENYEPEVELNTWLGVEVDGELQGFFLIQYNTLIMCDVHVGFKGSFDRSLLAEAWELLLQHLRKYYPYTKLVGKVAGYNRRAQTAAIKHGFKREGELTNSILKNGKYYSTILYGRQIWE